MYVSMEVLAVVLTIILMIVAGGAIYIHMSIDIKLKDQRLEITEKVADEYLKRMEWMLSEMASAARMTRMEHRLDKTDQD